MSFSVTQWGQVSMNVGYSKQLQAVTDLLLFSPGTALEFCLQCFGETLAHLPIALAGSQQQVEDAKCSVPGSQSNKRDIFSDWIPGFLSVARGKS